MTHADDPRKHGRETGPVNPKPHVNGYQHVGRDAIDEHSAWLRMKQAAADTLTRQLTDSHKANGIPLPGEGEKC